MRGFFYCEVRRVYGEMALGPEGCQREMITRMTTEPSVRHVLSALPLVRRTNQLSRIFIIFATHLDY